MRKKEIIFWNLVSELNHSNHILEIAEDYGKTGITANKYKEKIKTQEEEIFDYIIRNNIPLKVIPRYLDSVCNNVIDMNRKIDKKEIRKIKKKIT